MVNILSDEELLRTVETAKGRPRDEAAQLLGICGSVLRHRLRIAAVKGLTGYKPVLEGFEISKITNTPKGDFIQQRPARGDAFEMPPNHQIKGVSALIDGDNRVIQQWVKTKAEDAGRVAEESIRAAFEAYKGKCDPVEAPRYIEDDIATVYIIGDHHLGMYAWKDETGKDYDVEIGKNVLRYAMRNLLSTTLPSTTAVILSLGDFFHVDNSSNQTNESHNSLDLDTRRSKVCSAGVEVLIEVVELALSKHDNVTLKFLPGNHDPETTPWLSISFELFFRNNPRVTVDMSPSKHWFWQFGRVYLGATHGDKLKIQDLPMAMATYQPEMWGTSDFRYGYGGHIHHKKKVGDTIGGVYCETFEVLAPPDSWHASMGFRSNRSMVAITHHKTRGKITENICNINPRG